MPRRTGRPEPAIRLLYRHRQGGSHRWKSANSVESCRRFGWLLKDYKWSTQESGINNELSLGERHGHNIVAQQFGYEADITHNTAPGSSYPAGKLACTSCHDPHGTYRRPAMETSAPLVL